jgi:regulatory protein
MSDAYQDGVRLLARRSLTRREVITRLRARGHDDGDVEAAVDRLTALSAIDDEAFARHWIATQAAPRGKGRDRALAELMARGVEEGVAASVWLQSIDDGTIAGDDVLARAIRRRLGATPAPTERSRLARVYNALLHEGFGQNEVEAALAPYGFERIDP